MSKAVKSDGSVNAQVRRLCAQMTGRTQVDVDQFLRKDTILRQCQWGTLCLAADAYERAFGQKNWDIMRHIIIKARQSAEWRAIQNTRPTTAIEYDGETGESDDPLEVLKNLEAAKNPAA